MVIFCEFVNPCCYEHIRSLLEVVAAVVGGYRALCTFLEKARARGLQSGKDNEPKPPPDPPQPRASQ